MAPKNVDRRAKKDVNRGAWTAEEDRKLSQCIAIHGDRRWKSVPAKAGLNRCGKSCRLRWLNYLRPNIKRGNISDQEEDLIIRLHNLLGNRWSLIAGRLPGRTDNEIKNYWNSHLSKKLNNEKSKEGPTPRSPSALVGQGEVTEVGSTKAGGGDSMDEFNVDDFFDFSQDVGPTLGPHEDWTVEMFDDHRVVVPKGGGMNLEWVREFLDIDDLEVEANSWNVPSLS